MSMLMLIKMTLKRMEAGVRPRTSSLWAAQRISLWMMAMCASVRNEIYCQILHTSVISFFYPRNFKCLKIWLYGNLILLKTSCAKERGTEQLLLRFLELNQRFISLNPFSIRIPTNPSLGWLVTEGGTLSLCWDLEQYLWVNKLWNKYECSSCEKCSLSK